MKPVRFGVAGVCGAIGGTNVRAIRETPGAELVAVTDLNEGGAAQVAAAVGCEALRNFDWIVKRADIGAVCLCTPTREHGKQALAALKAGKHVLVERPLALTVDEADKVLAAAEKAGKTVGVMYPERLRPAARAAAAAMSQGRLGAIYRVTLVHTAFRTQHAFDAAPWRGTWAGAGGGVVMQQGLPFLDLLACLMGLPKRVAAWTATQTHSIETEDMATAMLEFEGGAQGMVHFNTTQAPGESYLEIVGDLATLRLSGADLRFYRPATPLKRFIYADRSHIYASPECTEQHAPPAQADATHADVVADFVYAVQHNRAPQCDGASGMKSLELADAILVSAMLGKPVDLPVNRSAAKRLLKQGKPAQPAASAPPSSASPPQAGSGKMKA
ncbi:MAG TPA: Gfo/Idh/MocA family oxidoreductase [Candidatus Brocadiia bacterium]|nr:Gfo/Idh/MocA family oxidoreductase [Candidatus Brocadiia bacterium]